MKDKDDGMDIVDMFKKASNFLDENEDMIRDVMPNSNTVDIDDQSPLTSAIVDDDEVIVTVESRGEGPNDVHIKEVEEGVVITLNGDTIKANVPSDIVIEEADVMLNNGVLEVTLPREESEE